LRRLGTPPDTVIELAPSTHPRTAILNTSLGLPDETARWPLIVEHLGPALGEGTSRLSLIRARTPEEEARAIAVCVHDALDSGQSVAILAPEDRKSTRLNSSHVKIS